MIRWPSVQDVAAMVALIKARAAGGEILPRSQNYVYQNLRDFVVFEAQGQVVACGSLHVLWGDLGEIRALAADGPAADGAEREIVAALLDEGRRLGLPCVFAFTRRPAFYLGLGFVESAREDLPRIIWRECVDCIKFPACDETTVRIDLQDPSRGEHTLP